MDTKKCFACRELIVNNNLIGLNKKLLGRKVKRFYCIDCLAEYFEINSEELLERIDDFKAQGCGLFE